MFDMESRLIQKELTNLKQILESALPQSSITPAFQWAQSANEIFLNVKFSHKIDAPATLNVEATNVSLSASGLLLQASDGRKLFKLQLTFLNDVIPEESSWSMGSVGRMIFTIRKKQDIPVKWKRLLKSDKKQSQMHFWYEMSENYKAELDKIDEDTENRLKADKKAKSDALAAETAKAEDEAEAKKERDKEEAKVKEQVEELVKKEPPVKLQKPTMGSLFGL